MVQKMDSFMDTLQDFVQNKTALVACVIVMINPLFWNIVSEVRVQNENGVQSSGRSETRMRHAGRVYPNIELCAYSHLSQDCGSVRLLGAAEQQPRGSARIFCRRSWSNPGDHQRVEVGVLCQFHGRLFRTVAER